MHPAQRRQPSRRKALNARARGRVERFSSAKVRGNPTPRDLVFVDPPYRTAAAAPALAALAAAGWIVDSAIAVVELDHREPFAIPEGFVAEDERSYGGTKILFLRHAAPKTESSL